MKPEEKEILIDPVEIRPTYSLFGPKRDMDYYLTPRSQFYSKNIARMINSGYIPKTEIAGWNPSKLKYNPEYHGTRANFRNIKRNARHNKQELKRAMRYAGSDQKSAEDRQFYNNLGKTMTGIVSLPAIGWGIGAAGQILTNPATYTNVVLPMLGGEVVNEVTRNVSDNKYNSFGDFVYHKTPLSKLKDGTDSNMFVKGFAEMFNPAYLFPYGKAVGYVMNGARTMYNAYNNLPVKIKFTPRENFRYRNIGGKDGLNDLLESGIVRAKQEVEPEIVRGINLNKSYKYPYFGGKGELIQTSGYDGKYFLGAKDIGNNFRRPKSTGGLIPINELTINDVTINRRILPKLTNSPYIEWSPGKYTEYNTPLKILQKNGFLTPNTPDNGFRLYSGIPIKMSANNKNYQELVEALRSEPFIIKSNTADDVFAFRRAVNSDDRFMAGVELKDRIGTLNRWNNYVGHGISKGPTEADNWANLRALLKYGIDKNRTFFQAPLQRVAPGEIHAGFGTASGTPYYDGPFVLVSPNSNPYNFTHVFINDSFENELGADLARRYKMMLQKEFPNIESLLYSEIK